jgi:hypothetical protein
MPYAPYLFLFLMFAYYLYSLIQKIKKDQINQPFLICSYLAAEFSFSKPNHATATTRAIEYVKN